MFFAVNRLSVSIQSMFFWLSVPNYGGKGPTVRGTCLYQSPEIRNDTHLVEMLAPTARVTFCSLNNNGPATDFLIIYMILVLVLIYWGLFKRSTARYFYKRSKKSLHKLISSSLSNTLYCMENMFLFTTLIFHVSL